MPDWQQRVVDELSELRAKIDKLTAYLSKPVKVISGSAGEKHRTLLERQLVEMTAYANTLAARIELVKDTRSMDKVVDMIDDYLVRGGLWAVELMQPDKVRDLLIECREKITSQQCKIPSWIPVSQLPKADDNTGPEYIVTNGEEVSTGTLGKFKDRDWFYVESGWKPTHWMPLPAPPPPTKEKP